jgi:hypothetical protein
MGVVYWGFRSRDPAENRRPAGHPGIATDAAKAFAVGAGTALRKSRSARVGLPGSLRKNVTCSVCQAIRAFRFLEEALERGGGRVSASTGDAAERLGEILAAAPEQRSRTISRRCAFEG